MLIREDRSTGLELIGKTISLIIQNMLQVSLTPEDIEALVKESIMKSGFGAAIEKSIAGMLSGYNNPIEDELRRYVKGVAADLIREKYAEQIKLSVAKFLEEKVSEDLIEQTTDGVLKKGFGNQY